MGCCLAGLAVWLVACHRLRATQPVGEKAAISSR